jgi:hypothetical protein
VAEMAKRRMPQPLVPRLKTFRLGRIKE